MRSLDRWIDTKFGKRFKNGIIFKLTPQRTGQAKGYVQAVLYGPNNQQRVANIHRLVAYAFIPNPNNYPQINHKDENPSKMAVLSLEMLKSDAIFNTIADDSIEMIFANTNASQNTDLKFIDSYKKQGSPSPSLFVYT